jgi:2-methylcitrate dehydratase
MVRTVERDAAQARIAAYAHGLRFDALPEEVVHGAKVRLIDTLGVLMGGFPGEPCSIARSVAAAQPMANGATVIGTRMRTTAEMAGFVNGTTLRFLDMNDNYNWPGSAHGHPSDALAAVLAAAEVAGANGRDLISAVVLAYEVFLRTSDMFRNQSMDTANLTCLASAVAAARLYGLDMEGIEQAISMAVVPNIILKQVRRGRKSMFKAVATGHAARAGVFSADLARAGMTGPDMPFDGEAGWYANAAHGRFDDIAWGGEGGEFRILLSGIKLRPANAGSIAAILAAERIAPISTFEEIKRVTVAVSAYTRRAVGSGPVPWAPDTREIADHSIPYLVATTLLDGTVDIGSFEPHKLRDARMRAMLPNIEVVEDAGYTRAYNDTPPRELARVTVLMADGTRREGLSEDSSDGLNEKRSDTQIERKFRALAEPHIGAAQVKIVLDLLWHAEELPNLSSVLEALVIDPT